MYKNSAICSQSCSRLAALMMASKLSFVGAMETSKSRTSPLPLLWSCTFFWLSGGQRASKLTEVLSAFPGIQHIAALPHIAERDTVRAGLADAGCWWKQGMNGSAVSQAATSHLPNHPCKPGERISEVGFLSK